MKPKTAFFLGAVSAKLDFLREDLNTYCGGVQWVTPEVFDALIDSVDKIRDLVSKIYDAENAKEEKT